MHKGFRFSVYNKLVAASGLEKKQVAQYALLPTATLSRGAKSGHFNTDESDRLFRLTQTMGTSVESKAVLDLIGQLEHGVIA